MGVSCLFIYRSWMIGYCTILKKKQKYFPDSSMASPTSHVWLIVNIHKFAIGFLMPCTKFMVLVYVCDCYSGR